MPTNNLTWPNRNVLVAATGLAHAIACIVQQEPDPGAITFAELVDEMRVHQVPFNSIILGDKSNECDQLATDLLARAGLVAEFYFTKRVILFRPKS